MNTIKASMQQVDWRCHNRLQLEDTAGSTTVTCDQGKYHEGPHEMTVGYLRIMWEETNTDEETEKGTDLH